MRIGVIAGPGEIGGALAEWWTQAGHDVVASTGGTGGDAGRVSVREAAVFGDAVLFAPAWESAHDVLDLAGEALAGKPVLDATDPSPAPGGPLLAGHAPGGLEQLTRWSPRAHWVKAFNTLPVSVLDARRGRDPMLAEFLCTDFADARKTASRLVRDLGLAPMYAGGADKAWITETGPLHMREIDIRDATAFLATALDALP